MQCAADEQCCQTVADEIPAYTCIGANDACCSATNTSCAEGSKCCGSTVNACIGGDDVCCEDNGSGFGCPAGSTCCGSMCVPAGGNACTGFGNECLGSCGMNESCCIGTANTPGGQQDFLAACCPADQMCKQDQQPNGEWTATCVPVPIAGPRL